MTLETPWVLATISAVVAALSSAVVTVYHGRIADLQRQALRQDELIDRLLNQVGRVADAADRSVSLAEREHDYGRRSK